MLVGAVVGDLMIRHVDAAAVAAAVGRRVGGCLDGSVGGAGCCGGEMRWVGRRLGEYDDVARRLGMNPVPVIVQPKRNN